MFHLIFHNKMRRLLHKAVQPRGNVMPITISENNVQRIKNIEQKKEILDTRRPFTQGELERLQEEFLINFTYNSNAIEGNTLTLRETALVLQGLTVDQKPLKDHLEAVGHKDAFNYVLDIAQNRVELSEAVIKDIHSLVLINRPQDKGRYRNIPVTIAGAYVKPVEPHFIEEKMQELLVNHMQHEQHVLVKVALFHLKFEGIHPFIDGNGRTGRLIANLDLLQKGYPPINIKFADRGRYYNAFDAYYGDKDVNPMLEIFADAAEESLDLYLACRE